jgi:predicted nucleotidyltransferase/uncharacterized protein (UPF0332 family)
MPTLASASLTEFERRALDTLIELLEAEHDTDLHAVWLYGSRARGDDHDESDIDLVVVTTAGHADWERVLELRERAAESEGIEPVWISTRVVSPEWIAERRAVEAFYIQEVDRDKIVLWGGEVEAPEAFTWHGEHGPVRQRTREYLAEAREELQDATAAARPTTVVAHAYYSVVNAATAALSEEDRFVRTHKGMWSLASELLVTTGKLPADLHRAAAALQPVREKAVYGPPNLDEAWVRPTQEQADAAVETARRYLAAVEELLGV